LIAAARTALRHARACPGHLDSRGAALPVSVIETLNEKLIRLFDALDFAAISAWKARRALSNIKIRG
jgi:hypothetical protein